MEKTNSYSTSQIIAATSYYGENFIMELLGANKRPDKSGADLEIEEIGEIEVKTVQKTQSVGISVSQNGIMRDRQNRLKIPQYYALCFYSMATGKRITAALQGCKSMSLDEYLKRYLLLESVFISPLPVVLDFFEQSSTTLKSRGTRTSNIGPIKAYFDDLADVDKKLCTLSKKTNKVHTELHVVGNTMIERIETVQRDTRLILG